MLTIHELKRQTLGKTNLSRGHTVKRAPVSAGMRASVNSSETAEVKNKTHTHIKIHIMKTYSMKGRLQNYIQLIEGKKERNADRQDERIKSSDTQAGSNSDMQHRKYQRAVDVRPMFSVGVFRTLNY